MTDLPQTTSRQYRRRYRARLPEYAIGGLFLASLLLFVALIPIPRADGQLIGSDGVYYYVFVRSLAIDRDLDFANEYAYFHVDPQKTGLTPIGRPANKYAVGPALLWMPFFLAAHLLALAGAAIGLGVAADGYSYLYQAAISIGSIVYGALGFWIAFGCARRMFASFAALAAVALLWLGSNAFYYMVFEPSMSHMAALFSVAAVLSVWWLRLRGVEAPSPRDAALLGAAGGLVLLVRLQDALFLLLPFADLAVRCVRAWRSEQRQRAGAWLWCGLLAGAIAGVIALPQLVVWQRLYGTWNALPYASERTPAFYWRQPQIGGVLFSSFHGLFSWHPVYFPALAGLALVARRDRWVGLALLALLALQVYLVAAWWAWWQGDSFGGRMFLSAMWIWVLGLAAAIDWLWARRALRAPALGVAALLLLWNALSLAQYRLGLVPMSAPLTWEQMTLDRIELPWALLQRILRRG